MGKREELRTKLKNYAYSNCGNNEQVGFFMKGVDAAMAEFVFDDEKTPMDVDVSDVKWNSPYQIPTGNDSECVVLAKYTDGFENPKYKVLYYKEQWEDLEGFPVNRPFVWTRIPK